MEFEKMELILPGSSELTRVIYYARYADAMLLGIPRAKAAKAVPVKMKDRLRRILSNVCGGLKFEFSWAEFARVHTRGKRSPLEVLGLLVFLSPEGG